MFRKLFIVLVAFFPLAAAAQTGTAYSAAQQLPPATLVNDTLLWPADNAQPWTLQQCIAYAQVHNITIQQQMLNVQLSEVNLRQSRGSVLPNLNGYASHTYQYGRTVDRYTNTFANSMVLSENFYLSSSVTVFSGMQNYNLIQQNKFNVESSRFQLAQVSNDIGMNVASAYLQVLFTQDQLDLAKQQSELTRKQVARTQQLVDAGAAAQGALFDLQSQLAQEDYNVVSAENSLTIAYLSLTQLMNLDSTAGFSIVRPNLDVPNEAVLAGTPDAIFQAALQSQPAIKRADMDYKSADKGVDVAYGALSPTLTLQGSIGTGYSGAAKDITGVNYAGYDTTGLTTGGDYVLTPNFTYNSVTTPWNDQISSNVNKSFGVQLTIPIFNRFQVSSSIERAKIQRESAQLNIDLAHQQLRKNIDQAWADAKAALEKYHASQKAVDAAQESFRYTEQKFNVGTVNSMDFNNSKNQLNRAQSQLIQAKYDYIFRLKVLDYYQGKPLTF